MNMSGHQSRALRHRSRRHPEPVPKSEPSKTWLFKTIVVLFLAVCLGANYKFFRSLEQLQSRLDSRVSVEDYNKMVGAEQQIVLSLNNLTRSMQADRAQLHQLNLQLQQVSSVTNVYPKIQEVEDSVDNIASQTQQQMQDKATLSARATGKLDALEKAVIKLSLAVQENQFQAALLATNLARSRAAGIASTNLVQTLPGAADPAPASETDLVAAARINPETDSGKHQTVTLADPTPAQ